MDIIGDVRYAVRTLRDNPGFAAAALLTMAVGIGANTAVFSVANSVLLQPLPYPDADRIVALMTTWRGRGSVPTVSAPKFFGWRSATNAFEDPAAYRVGGGMNLTNVDQPAQVAVAQVEAGFFRLFGARATLGRTFTAEEDRPGGPKLVVLSDGFWQRHTGADPDVIGRTLSLDDDRYVVIGVLDHDFNAEPLSISSATYPDVWLPLRLDAGDQSDAPFLAAARLRAGVSLAVAQAQTAAAAAAVREAVPTVMPADAGLGVEPLQAVLVRDVRPALLALLAAVACVLLIACTNTANLLLIRASVREREMAIRAATGASRARLARQLMTESVVLSLAGGAVGLLLALTGLRVLATNADSIPRIVANGAAPALEWRVLLFALLVSTAAGVAFGLAPAWWSSRVNIEAALKAGGSRTSERRGQRNVRMLLVVSEVAFALMLLVGSVLLIRSFVTLRSVDPGLVTRGVLTMQVALTSQRFATTAGTASVVRDGLTRIESVPGVDVAAATLTGPPLSGGMSFLNITVPGRSLDGPYYAGGYLGGWHLISPRYFDVFSIPVVAGRVFTDRDDWSSPPVVIVNQAMVRQFWPNDDPLNRQILIGQGAGPDFEDTTPRQIVGVVGDIRHVGLEWNPRPTVYVPVAQMADRHAAFFNRVGARLSWVVRSHDEPYRIANAIQQELRVATGGLPATAIRSMDDVSAASTGRMEFNMWLMTIFGASALLLAAVGISGVVSYTVRQRTREIGIRLALGADSRRIRTMILLQGMTPALIGIAIGTAGAFGLAQSLTALLYGISPHDRVVFLTAPIVLGLVALAAVWLPMRRSALVEPATALRHD